MTTTTIVLRAGDTVTVTAESTTQPPTQPPTEPPTEPIPPGALLLDIPWTSTYKRYLTSNYGGFGANQVMIIRFTTPTAPQTNSGFAGAEYASTPSNRECVLSTKPGDFTPQPNSAANIPASYSPTFQIPSITGSPDNLQQSGWQQLRLQVGKTYYINVRNGPQGGDMFWDFTP